MFFDLSAAWGKGEGASQRTDSNLDGQQDNQEQPGTTPGQSQRQEEEKVRDNGGKRQGQHWTGNDNEGQRQPQRGITYPPLLIRAWRVSWIGFVDHRFGYGGSGFC